MEEAKGKMRHSRAGLSTLQRHRKEIMGPWSYALFGVLFASLVLLVLFLVAFVSLWIVAACTPAMLATYLVWDKKTDPINNSWGEGARGEARVGAELERLQKVASTSSMIGILAGATSTTSLSGHRGSLPSRPRPGMGRLPPRVISL